MPNAAIKISAPGPVTNTDNILEQNGYDVYSYLTGPTTFTNSGTIIATSNNSIVLPNNGIVINLEGGFVEGNVVLGPLAGRSPNETVGTLDNYGSIIAKLDIQGYLTNGSPTNTTASISGPIYISVPVGDAGTARNFGTINGYIIAGNSLSPELNIVNGASDSTAALITSSIAVDSYGSIVNYGTLNATGSGDPAVILHLITSALTNGVAGTSDGLISAVNIGVDARYGVITNYGSIIGGVQGVLAAAIQPDGVSVTNGASNSTGAMISGGSVGLQLNGGTGRNFGTIAGTGTISNGVSIYASTLTNGTDGSSAGLITGTTSGIFIGGVSAITNFGEIAATGSSASAIDVEFNGGASGTTITNYGTISATSGQSQGVSASNEPVDIMNLAGGVIEGGKYGVSLQRSGTITNAGIITASGTTSTGVHTSNYPVSFINTTTGTITGGSYGVFFGISPTLGTNLGTIRADVGVYLGGGQTFTTGGTIDGSSGVAVTMGEAGGTHTKLVVLPGAVFNGAAIGRSSTLELGGTTAGTLQGTEFQGFGSVTIDSGSQWALTGGIIAFSSVDVSGAASLIATLDTSGHFDVGLSDHGTLTVANGGVLNAEELDIGTGGGASNGQMTVDSGGTVTAPAFQMYHGIVDMRGGVLNLPSGYNPIYSGGEIDGFGSVDGDLNSDGTLSASGGSLFVAGDVDGSGEIDVSAGASMEFGGSVAASQAVTFEGTDATLILDAPREFATQISGFKADDSITLMGANVSAADITTDGVNTFISVESSRLELFDFAGPVTTDNTMGENSVVDTTVTGSGTPICYVRGTRILTSTGEMRVEDIRIGTRVVTRFGGIKPVLWIGRQSFNAGYMDENSDARPVLIRAGALDDELPYRDLSVSPGHSMLIGGHLIVARHLINGITITWDPEIRPIDYLQIELDGHDCVIAEGTWSETFADFDDLRDDFHNVAEFHALYPNHRPAEPELCAPRPTCGAKLAAVLSRVVSRASARVTPGALEGCIDLVRPWKLEGWAWQPECPDLPVLLEVVVENRVIGTILACEFRIDLRDAGKGSGRCAFFFTSPTRLSPDLLSGIIVRRVSDHAGISMSAQLRAAADSAPRDYESRDLVFSGGSRFRLVR